MKVAELETTILETARELYDKGPGFAQQSVVLREVAQKIGPVSVNKCPEWWIFRQGFASQAAFG